MRVQSVRRTGLIWIHSTHVPPDITTNKEAVTHNWLRRYTYIYFLWGETLTSFIYSYKTNRVIFYNMLGGFLCRFVQLRYHVKAQCVSPEEFQNTVWAKAPRWEVRCHRLGTAAGGRRAACRAESCTGTGSGTAGRTGCCPCYGSHSSQRTCWWPLSWPVSRKTEEEMVTRRRTGLSKNDKGIWTQTHHDGFSLKCFYFLS